MTNESWTDIETIKGAIALITAHKVSPEGDTLEQAVLRELRRMLHNLKQISQADTSEPRGSSDK